MKEKSKEFVVYKITHISSGKTYIGITTNYKRRMNTHFSNGRLKVENSYIHRAINKHSKERFASEIIGHCNSWESLCKKEIKFIKKYNTKTPNGYNLTDGGEGALGLKHTEETKIKLSKLKIGKRHTKETKIQMGIDRAGEKHFLFGKTHTKETKIKISKTRIQNGLSVGEKNPMFGKRHTEDVKRNSSKLNTGRKHSEVARLQMSESRKGNKNHMFGKKHTSNTKTKISLAKSKLTLKEKEQVLIRLNMGIKSCVLAEQYNVGRHVIGFIKKHSYKTQHS